MSMHVRPRRGRSYAANATASFSFLRRAACNGSRSPPRLSVVLPLYLTMSPTHLALLAVAFSACTPNLPGPEHPAGERSPNDGMWWAPELGLESLESVPQRLEQPFDAPFDVVAVVGGQMQTQVAASCSATLPLAEKGYQPMSDGDAAAFKLDVARCQVIKALGSAKPAAASSLATFRLDADPLSALPPALGPEPSPADVEARQEATRSGKSWRLQDPDATVTAADSRHGKVSGSDWTTELELLARADFDADGRDDILILALSYGTEGSWREVRLHQLTAGEGPILRLVRQLPL
jgi:hypothetical protein